VTQKVIVLVADFLPLKDLGYSYCDANRKVRQENVARVGSLPHPQTSSMILHLKDPNWEKAETNGFRKGEG
jgi:hypothetical protein